MEGFTPEQTAYVFQFQHLEKVITDLPGVNDAAMAALFGVNAQLYRDIRDGFAQRARAAAQELLADPAFAQRVDQLPFQAGETVVGLGDSITDDDQSWLEILRHLLDLRRAEDAIRVLNMGVSGDTTSQMITRFLDVVLDDPDWVICMPGTNDARLHGECPTKVLVSVEETAKNLAMLRNFGATQTSARWVWMTPATVDEDMIETHWFLSPFELRWRNADLVAIAKVVRRQPDPVVDLQSVFGLPPDPTLLLPDGLHPSLAGQKAIVRALVETLTG
jgi:lysophospholipase L1-like esterase